MKAFNKYVAFLRGINVGGHHKFPMAILKKEMEKLGFKKVETILNSGNVIFESENSQDQNLKEQISQHLEKTVGFPVPVIIIPAEKIAEVYEAGPFKDVEVTKDTRLYITFLKDHPEEEVIIPWTSPDNSFRIPGRMEKTVFSVLDLSATKTTDAMKSLEELFGRDITTRNWNTLERIFRKL